MGDIFGLLMWGVGGLWRSEDGRGRRFFHILCSDGSRTHCLLCADIDLGSFSMASQVFWSMFAHISQCVREQPDTGYRKSLRRRADPAPGIGGGWWCVFWEEIL